MALFEGILTKTTTVYPVNPEVGSSSVWITAGTLVLAEPVDDRNFQITTRRQGVDFIAVVRGELVVCGAERVPSEKESS